MAWWLADAVWSGDGKENPGTALNAIPGFRCVVLCGVVGGFQVLLGFWCGCGFAAGVGGAQRDGSGCHEAEGADEQGPLEPGGECLRWREVGGQQVAGAAGRDPAEHRQAERGSELERSG